MKKQKNGKSEKGAENRKGLGAKTAALNEALKDKMPSFSRFVLYFGVCGDQSF